MLGPLDHSARYRLPIPPSSSVLRVGHRPLRTAPEGLAPTQRPAVCSREFFNREASCKFSVVRLSLIGAALDSRGRGKSDDDNDDDLAHCRGEGPVRQQRSAYPTVLLSFIRLHSASKCTAVTGITGPAPA